MPRRLPASTSGRHSVVGHEKAHHVQIPAHAPVWYRSCRGDLLQPRQPGTQANRSAPCFVSARSHQLSYSLPDTAAQSCVHTTYGSIGKLRLVFSYSATELLTRAVAAESSISDHVTALRVG